MVQLIHGVFETWVQKKSYSKFQLLPMKSKEPEFWTTYPQSSPKGHKRNYLLHEQQASTEVVMSFYGVAVVNQL